MPQRPSSLPRDVNIAVVVLPLLGLLVAIVLLWNRAVGWSDIAVLIFMYTLTTLGITAGFHRLLTHRAFKTYPSVRYTFAVLGSMAVENPVIIWVADHRQHHTFADVEGDPHSPHTHDGEGVLGVLRGLWHAHIGWLLDYGRKSDPIRYAPDLLRDHGMRRISTMFIPLVLLGLLIPFLLGLGLTQSVFGGLTAILWGGFVRIFLQHHMTFSVNSIGHYFGRRRWQTDDKSTNVAWLALPSLGDSWHHNHHAFPTSARHGLRWWELDLSWLTILALKNVGLAWDVKVATPAAMRRRRGTAAAE